MSVISLWEITVKLSLNKLEISHDIETIIDLLTQNGFEILPVIPRHFIELAKLPFHHRDPFDRLLVAQIKTENIHFISKDEILDKYDILRIW
ncbi:type II toxin-antitoxin system VapC family toxin [candidate division KSB1 bacterium]|nr:type II toxin-antitoxin system VapC family toxin [candidate division KSB1 bacterium]